VHNCLGVCREIVVSMQVKPLADTFPEMGCESRCRLEKAASLLPYNCMTQLANNYEGLFKPYGDIFDRRWRGQSFSVLSERPRYPGGTWHHPLFGGCTGLGDYSIKLSEATLWL
jgi:hypothetical protein